MANCTKKMLKCISDKLDSQITESTSNNGEVIACLTDIKELLETQNTLIDGQVDFEFKVLSKQCYECSDGSIYTEVLCAKYKDGVFIENVLQYIVGTDVVDIPPCEGIPCVPDSFETIKLDVCFDDCTTGYQLIKINTKTDKVSVIGTFNLNGAISTKTIVECPELTIIQETLCEVS